MTLNTQCPVVDTRQPQFTAFSETISNE